MIILLDGTSAMGRATIAEKVTERLPAWKHLALEVIQEVAPEVSDEEKEQHLEIVRRCAEELAKDNFHLILSMPHSPERVQMLRQGLDDVMIAVHLGEGDEEGYDYAFDASVSSVNDIVTFLQHLIDSMEKE